MPNERIVGLRVLCGCLALCAEAQENKPEPAPTVASVLEKQRYGAEVDLFVAETEAAAMSDDEGFVVEGMSYRVIPDRPDRCEWTVSPSGRRRRDKWLARGDVPEISAGVAEGRSISITPH